MREPRWNRGALVALVAAGVWMVACSVPDTTGLEPDASAGAAGSVSTGGSAGTSGTAGTGGTAGTAGSSGKGGEGGAAGEDGGAGTAGSAGEGDASTEGDAATSCDGGAETLGVNGGPCCNSNELACAGHAQKVVLMCDPITKKWGLATMCTGSQLCDSTAGANQGSCQDPVALCVGHTPGDKLCDGATAVECGPDLVTAPTTPCTGATPACLNGACVACNPGETKCNNLVPQSCNGGQWQDGNACPYLCKNGACQGSCVPGIKDCLGLTPRTCDTNGAWHNETGCPYACDAGACVGSCSLGSKRCAGAGFQTCETNLLWGPVTGCAGATPRCTNGDCVACGPLEDALFGIGCTAKSVAVTGGYSIDVTEVTAAQYADWLASSPTTALLPAGCTSWKSTFHAGSGTGNKPAVEMDWCDAFGYCAGVGKRLCGKIGGGTNVYTEFANASLSQWFNACSSGGVNTYPYGATSQSATCNGYAKGAGAELDVGSLVGCQSVVAGFTGAFDLSGNVWEFEDSCDANLGGTDHCLTRGGSYSSGIVELSCDNGDGILMRNQMSGAVGLRCCSL